MLKPSKTPVSGLVAVIALGIMVSASACNFDVPQSTEPGSITRLPTPDTSEVVVIEDQIPADLADPDAVSAFQTGYNEMLARRWYSAIAAYDKAVRLEPGSAGLYSARGTAHRYAGDHDGAIADYTKAIELEPENAGHWRRRSHAHNTGSSPEPEKAVADATKAIELDPDHHMGYAHRAVALTMLATPDWHAALADMDRSIERHPKHDPTTYKFRAWINDQLGYHSQAERDRQMAQ